MKAWLEASARLSLVAALLAWPHEAHARNGVIARYTTSGQLDQNFASTGFVQGPSNTFNLGVAVREGKVYTTGGFGTLSHALLGRFTSKGVPDSTFGYGGVTTFALDPGNIERADEIAFDSQGNIFVACDTSTPQGLSKAFVAKFAPNGVLDTSYASGGFAFPFATGLVITGIVSTTDGRQIAVATAENAGLTVARLDSTGTAEWSNRYTFEAGLEGSTGNDIALDPQGRIYVVGRTPSKEAGVIRLKTNGVLDTTFGTGGRRVVNFGQGDHVGTGISIDSIGQVFLVATEPHRATADAFLAKLSSSGADLESGTYSFGAGGTDTFFKIRVNPGAGVYLAGAVDLGGQQAFAIAKLNTALDPVIAFGSQGQVFGPIGETLVGFSDLAVDNGRPIVVGAFEP